MSFACHDHACRADILVDFFNNTSRKALLARFQGPIERRILNCCRANSSVIVVNRMFCRRITAQRGFRAVLVVLVTRQDVRNDIMLSFTQSNNHNRDVVVLPAQLVLAARIVGDARRGLAWLDSACWACWACWAARGSVAAGCCLYCVCYAV